MAKILVNYVYNRATDEYILQDTKCVFADMKIAILETEDVINTPLIVPINGMSTVVDRATYESIHKKFCLIADQQGNVFESPKGKEVWLPKDTDISKLKVINGQLVFVDDSDKTEVVSEHKPKTKSKK